MESTGSGQEAQGIPKVIEHELAPVAPVEDPSEKARELQEESGQCPLSPGEAEQGALATLQQEIAALHALILAQHERTEDLSYQLGAFISERRSRERSSSQKAVQVLLDLHNFVSGLLDGMKTSGPASGLELLRCRVEEHLATCRVHPLGARAGDRFDARSMRAVTAEPDPTGSRPDKTVSRVHRDGWIRKDQEGTCVVQAALVSIVIH